MYNLCSVSPEKEPSPCRTLWIHLLIDYWFAPTSRQTWWILTLQNWLIVLLGLVNKCCVFWEVRIIMPMIIWQQPWNTKLTHSSYPRLVDSPECKRWLQLQRRAYAARGPVDWQKRGLWVWTQSNRYTLLSCYSSHRETPAESIN